MSKRRTSGDTALNAIIAAVIIVVLGLGVWAVAPKISEGIKNRETASQNTDNQTQQTVTIGQKAESEGISFDEYISKYGLADEGLTAEDDYQTALYAMTVDNFAKATQTTFDDVVSEYKLPESVKPETKWSEAMLEMPAGVALGGDDQFAQAKEAYGLGDEFTADSRWGDVQNAMIQKMMENQAQAQASAEPSESAQPEDTAAPSETPAADKQ